jgi:hypothetical protein
MHDCWRKVNRDGGQEDRQSHLQEGEEQTGVV